MGSGWCGEVIGKIHECNFFGGFFIFSGTLEIISAFYDAINYLHIESSNWYDDEFGASITGFFIGITIILIGFNNRSYVKGTSIIAQRNFIFFGIIIMWGLDIIIKRIQQFI